jgi:hypothetical protein
MHRRKAQGEAKRNPGNKDWIQPKSCADGSGDPSDERLGNFLVLDFGIDGYFRNKKHKQEGKEHRPGSN